jgi:alkanesulfonate monooxygenase
VRQACVDHGRDPDDLEWSFWFPIAVGRDDSEVARRAAAIGRDVDEIVETAFGGSPQQVIDKISAYREAGATKVGFQMLDLTDLDHIELVKNEVVDKLT